MKKKIGIITLLLIIILLILLVVYLLFIKEKTITITFDTDGGTNISEISLKEHEQIKLPTNPKKEGYVFKGWTDENGNTITKDTIVTKNMVLKAVFVKPYTCPSDCTPTNDGSKCTKTITTNMINKTTCPSGYSLKNGKCLSGSKYHATNSNGTWKCNSNSDYMYSEEDGVGGAFMWCVKTTNVVSSKTCPSSYTKDNNTCKKTQTINCTKN